MASTIFLLTLVGYLSWRHFPPKIMARADKIRLAVLPFQNLTGDPSQEYLADGLTEEMISQLGRLNPDQLAVIARTSVMRYKRGDETLDQIGRELSVQYVLENSLRESGDQIRLTAQLIQVKDQSQVWSRDYDYAAKDVLNVEDEVANAVAREVQLRLTSQQREELSRPRPLNPEALDAYMKGYYFFDRVTDKDTNTGVMYFERATQIDPGYALAWGALSRAQYWRANTGLVPLQEGQRLAREAIEHALALDPNLPEAYAQMARIQRQVDFDWVGANVSIRRAIALAPGVPENLSQAAFMAELFGQFDEALRLNQQALELDPLNAGSWEGTAENNFYAGDLDEALVNVNKALELNPDTWSSPTMLSQIYVLQGKPQDALRQVERMRFVSERPRMYAIAYHALGREKESNAALRELIEKYPASFAFSIATVYAFRNQREEAFEWLDRAYAQHDGGLIFIKIHPLLKNLHGDPRYAALLEKLHFPT